MDEHLFDGHHHRENFTRLNLPSSNVFRNTNDDHNNIRPNEIHRRHVRQNASSSNQRGRRRNDDDADDDRTQEFIHLENPRPPILRKTNLYVDVNNVASTSATASNLQPTVSRTSRAPIHLHTTTTAPAVGEQRNRILNNNNVHHRRPMVVNNNNTGITSSSPIINNIFDDDDDSSAFVHTHRSENSSAKQRTRQQNDQNRAILLNNVDDGDFIYKIPNNKKPTPGRSVRLLTLSDVNNSNALVAAPPSSSTAIITNQPTKRLTDPHRTNLPTIICRECNKCRCQACMTPRPLPSKYICNRRCLCSAENVVDWLSCYKMVKCCWYHMDELDAEDEVVYGGNNGRRRCGVGDGDDHDRTCKCLPSSSSSTRSNCLLKCTCLSASLILLPCLWCYPALKCCSWLCSKCYSRYHDNGCRCNPRRIQYASSTATTPSQTKILPPPFNLRTTSLDSSTTTTTIVCSQPLSTTTTERHLLKLHEPP